MKSLLTLLPPLLLLFSFTTNALSAETQAPQGSCDALGLNPSASAKNASDNTAEFYKALADLEKSINKSDGNLFVSLMHPAVIKSDKDKHEIFQSTLQQFNLEGATLARTGIQELKFSETGPRTAECRNGVYKGVSGPTHQYAVIHSHLRGREQIRVTSIFATIPDSLREAKKTKYRVGLVMLHAQVWSHDKKSPEVYLNSAKKKLANDPFSAWMEAETARRLFDANPYFLPKELQEAVSLSKEAEEKRGGIEKAKALVSESQLGWELLELTVAFRGEGIEPAAKFRTRADESLHELVANCEKAVKATAAAFPAISQKYQGMECLPYLPEEPLETAPSLGSAFVRLKR